MSDQDLINKFVIAAVDLAWQARSLGDHPFGAVLVHNNKILLSARNTVNTDKDVTQHAELQLVSHASKTISSDILKNAILYTSTEPCAMCAGAIYWSGIRNVIFGCSSKTLAKFAGGSLIIPCTHIFSNGAEKVSVTGPINEDHSQLVHVGFWKRL